MSSVRLAHYSVRAHQRIDSCRAARRHIRRHHRDSHEHHDHGGECRQIERCQTKQQPLEIAAERRGADHTDHDADDSQHRCLTQHEGDDTEPLCAERHANTDLAGAMRDEIRQDTVDANRGEQHRHRGEDAEQDGIQARP